MPNTRALNAHCNFRHQRKPATARCHSRKSSKKMSKDLKTLKAIFESWSDQDLLAALEEADGDVTLTVTRITEGLTQQWHSTTKTKPKKEKPVVAERGRGARRGRGRGGVTRPQYPREPAVATTKPNTKPKEKWDAEKAIEKLEISDKKPAPAAQLPKKVSNWASIVKRYFRRFILVLNQKLFRRKRLKNNQLLCQKRRLHLKIHHR